MMPFLKEGDIVLYKRKDIKVGSIILFHYGEIILTHRLIEEGDAILTKGDNTPYWDKSISKTDVIGVAELVIRNNKIIHLNNNVSNIFSVFYARLEMKLITFLKRRLYLKTDRVNSCVKACLTPIFALSYIFYLFNCTKRE